MDLSHIDSLRPFGPLLFIEADPLAFTQALESISYDALVMYKHIFTFLCLYKTVTLAVIKPFNYAFHNNGPFPV